MNYTRYCDREGREITADRWRELRKIDGYREIAEDTIGETTLTTYWTGVDKSGHKFIFQTRLAIKRSDYFNNAPIRKYRLEGEARVGHQQELDKLIEAELRWVETQWVNDEAWEDQWIDEEEEETDVVLEAFKKLSENKALKYNIDQAKSENHPNWIIVNAHYSGTYQQPHNVGLAINKITGRIHGFSEAGSPIITIYPVIE